MNSQFGAYGKYYDLLYQDKDYVAETKYVFDLLSRFGTNVSSVLELGTGTGRHASILAEFGLQVVGVELSDSMIEHAHIRASAPREKGTFSVLSGDARTVDCNRVFDAVVSLFHVVSYQLTNADVSSMFHTAARHLNENGLFVFDIWYGPAVVSMLPSVRIKRMNDVSTEVLRIAEPTIDMNQNRVDVMYTVLVTNRNSGTVEQLTEKHHMRYYFMPELNLLAEIHGLQIVHSEEWMTSCKPSEKTWGVTFVAKKCR